MDVLKKAKNIAGNLVKGGVLVNENIGVCNVCCCVYSTVLYAVYIDGDFLHRDNRDYTTNLKTFINYCPHCGALV